MRHHLQAGRYRSPLLETLEDRRLLTASYVYQQPFAGGYLMRTESESLPLLTGTAGITTNQTGSFDIQLQKSPALLANPEASAAFDMAAEFLESIFFDPVTIVVDADVSLLPPGVIGATSSVDVSIGYDELRDLLIADADEDETLPAQLPTLAQAQVELPDDGGTPFTLLGAEANRATLKALGVPENTLPGPQSQYNPSLIRDMSMAFSTAFTFDFDPTDGITPGMTDFVGVAIHEICHGLGFVSTVDYVDFALGNTAVPRGLEVNPLDLFRLRPGAGGDDFTGSPRVLTTEGDAVFYDGVYNPVGFNIPGLTQGDIPMSTGSSTGDGWQASHWKNDDITGVTIGIMDPTAGGGQLLVFSPADLRAFGLIGYDLTEPIPPLELNVLGDAVLEGDEGTTELVFTIEATNDTTESYTVEYATVDVTATAGVDYLPVSGTLTFTPEGPLVQTVTVSVIGELLVEDNESFLLRLSNPTDPAGLGIGEAAGVILNDDIEVSIGDASVTEGPVGTRLAVFTVTVLGGVGQPVTVYYSTLNDSATSASDYLPQAGTLNFSPQVTTATISVTVLGDTLNEGTETFFVLLSRIEGARLGKAVGVGTIFDDDPQPFLYVNDVYLTTTSAGVLAAEFTVALDTPSGRQVTVPYATSDGTAQAGVDYAAQSGVVTFAPGVTAMPVMVPVSTSATPSANKRFYLNLSSTATARLGDPQGAGTIVFADHPAGEYVMDNGDTGHSHTGTWTGVTNTLASGLDYDYATPGDGSGTSSWSFTAIPNGSYEVFARWVPFGNRATNAPYTIYDRNTPLGTVAVNQQAAPSDDLSNGQFWHSLGTFATTSHSLTVKLSNAANGYVIADAVRILAGGVGAQVPEMDVAAKDRSISTGDVTPATLDGTDFGTVPSLGVSITQEFTITNNGNAPLNLTGNPPVVVTGPQASDFTVVRQPAAVVAPGAKTTFEVKFRPTGDGVRQAVISIANNDTSENPYAFVVQGSLSGAVPQPLLQNAALPQDVNDDGRVSANDALILINHLLSGPTAAPQAASAAALAEPAGTPVYYVDVNGDGRVSAIDALMVINYLLSPPPGPAAAPQAATAEAAPLSSAAVDEAVVSESSDEEESALSMPYDAALPEAPPSRVETSSTTWLLEPEEIATESDESPDAEIVVYTDLELAFVDG